MSKISNIENETKRNTHTHTKYIINHSKSSGVMRVAKCIRISKKYIDFCWIFVFFFAPLKIYHTISIVHTFQSFNRVKQVYTKWNKKYGPN